MGGSTGPEDLNKKVQCTYSLTLRRSTPCPGPEVANKKIQCTYSFSVRKNPPCPEVISVKVCKSSLCPSPELLEKRCPPCPYREELNIKEQSLTECKSPCPRPEVFIKKDQSVNVRKSPPCPCPELLQKNEQRLAVLKCPPCLYREDLNYKEQSFTVGKDPPCPCPNLLQEKDQHLSLSKSPTVPRADELIKKEQYLNQLAKELIQLQKKLEKQQSRLKKKLDTKAKADLKAAKKMNRARKKLQLTVDATTKVGHHKTEKKKTTTKKKQSLEKSFDKCIDKQWKWVDKIHSKVGRLHDGVCSCFFGKRRGFSEFCALYLNKMKGTNHHSELVCARCSRGTNLDYCYGRAPCGCSRRLSPAGDCFGMAMGPTLWSNPFSTQPCRPQCIGSSLKNCCALMAAFIFWFPCLLCIACLCCCYSCCCYEC